MCYTTRVNRILHRGGPEPSIARKRKRNGRVFAEGESHLEFNELGLSPDSVTDSVARGRSLHFSETQFLSAQMGVFVFPGWGIRGLLSGFLNHLQVKAL